MEHGIIRRLIVVALAWSALGPAFAGNKQTGPVVPIVSGAPVVPNLSAASIKIDPTAVSIPAIPQAGEMLEAAQILTSAAGQQLAPESQQGVAGQLFGEQKASKPEDLPAVPGAESSVRPLAAPSAGALTPAPVPPKPSRGRRWVTIGERVHYNRLWAQNLYFYIVTNIVTKWGQYQKDRAAMIAAGETPPVSKPRRFFAYMRVMGQTGVFVVPGFAPRADADVKDEARETFNKYFDAPGIGKKEKAAFEGFLQRAIVYNAEKRAASKFRALVRDRMLEASTMPVSRIAAYFDALPEASKTAEFQAGEAAAIRQRFEEIVLEEVNREPKDAKDRVTGIILIGSFALGAATPTSDFDVEPLTADGTSGRVAGFAERLKKRWIEEGRQAVNPVTFHMFGYLNSRWELQKIHHEPYLIISPDPSIVANLSMRPDDPPRGPSRKLQLHGRFLRWLQYAAVYGTSLTVRKPK